MADTAADLAHFDDEARMATIGRRVVAKQARAANFDLFRALVVEIGDVDPFKADVTDLCKRARAAIDQYEALAKLNY